MRLSTLCFAALLALGLAVPAAAEHAENERVRLDRHEASERSERPQRRAQPKRIRNAQLHEQALALENQTARLLKKALRNADRPNRAERKAIRKLRKLHAEASDFRVALERRRRPVAIVPEFRELRRAYVGAAKNLNRLHPNRGTRRAFQRVAWSVTELSNELEPIAARSAHRDGRREQLAWAHSWK